MGDQEEEGYINGDENNRNSMNLDDLDEERKRVEKDLGIS